MEHKIILIGYMGSGKTTLGKKLALELKVPFIDSDEAIVQITNRTISQIFAEDGEEAFRKLESSFIESLSQKGNFILSTGGGMPCFNNNMEALNKLGTTIYLKNTSEALADRLLIAKNERPLIKGKSKDELIQFIEENIQKREVFYNQARVVLNSDQQGILDVYQKVKSI